MRLLQEISLLQSDPTDSQIQGGSCGRVLSRLLQVWVLALGAKACRWDAVRHVYIPLRNGGGS